MSIVKNTPVRRQKADITVSDFVNEVKELSRLYSQAASSSGPQSLAVWEAIKQWDATQVGDNFEASPRAQLDFHTASALLTKFRSSLSTAADDVRGTRWYIEP